MTEHVEIPIKTSKSLSMSVPWMTNERSIFPLLEFGPLHSSLTNDRSRTSTFAIEAGFSEASKASTVFSGSKRAATLTVPFKGKSFPLTCWTGN